MMNTIIACTDRELFLPVFSSTLPCILSYYRTHKIYSSIGTDMCYNVWFEYCWLGLTGIRYHWNDCNRGWVMLVDTPVGLLPLGRAHDLAHHIYIHSEVLFNQLPPQTVYPCNQHTDFCLLWLSGWECHQLASSIVPFEPGPIIGVWLYKDTITENPWNEIPSVVEIQSHHMSSFAQLIYLMSSG